MAGYSSVFAKRVADNCGGLTGESNSGNPVAFDPITIATLITTLTPVIGPTLNKWIDPDRKPIPVQSPSSLTKPKSLNLKLWR